MRFECDQTGRAARRCLASLGACLSLGFGIAQADSGRPVGFNAVFEIVENSVYCEGDYDRQFRIHIDAKDAPASIGTKSAVQEQRCFGRERRGNDVIAIEIPCASDFINRNPAPAHYSKFSGYFSVHGTVDICDSLWGRWVLDSDLEVETTLEGEPVPVPPPQVDPYVVTKHTLQWEESYSGIPRWEQSLLGPFMFLSFECLPLPKPEDIEDQAYAAFSLALFMSEDDPKTCGPECYSSRNTLIFEPGILERSSRYFNSCATQERLRKEAEVVQ